MTISTRGKSEPTQIEKDAIDDRFLRSEMGRGLLASGIELVRSDVPTNFSSLTRIQEKQWKTKQGPMDFEWTIMGKELREVNSVQAQKGLRIIEKKHSEYMSMIKPLDAWSYWQQKGMDELHKSKSWVDVDGQVETLSHYWEHADWLDDVDSQAFENLRPYICAVLEDFDDLFKHTKLPSIDEVDKWKSQMNFNRNSGWPYHMPISSERWTTIDWPNSRQWVKNLASADTAEQVIGAMKSTPTVVNANDEVYTAFFRPEDRVIHGVRLLLKGPGAYAGSCNKGPMKDSDIAWKDLDSMADEFANALGDAIGVAADDLKKFDRTIHPRWFNLIWECIWETGFLQRHPELRSIIAGLVWEMTNDVWLQIAPSRRLRMHSGLWSGHPLTQWIGSVIHLALYKMWNEKYSLNPTLEKVLSDDGIRIFNDVTPAELESLLHNEMADDLSLLGMTMHPDKTVVSDPSDEVYVGQLDGNEMFMIDMPYFLKRNFQPQKELSHGNPLGVTRSFLQTERGATDAAIESSVDPYIRGFDDLTLGGGPPRRLYDIARVVDVLASGGRGNPLVEDHIFYVQKTWPGFEKSGIDYLTNKIDAAWRKTETSYAGGTLDSGLAREWAVEALLDDSDGYKVWDEIAFH